MDNPVTGYKSLPKGGKIAVAIGGAVIVYYVWKKHSASTAAASTASAAPSTDPAGNVGVIDPQTGYVYGSPQDQAALNQSGGYNGYGYTDQSLGTTGPASSTTFGNNAAWAQAVQNGLETVGYAPTDVAQALGLYLGNQAMTNTQAGIIHAAIAEYGYPPVGTFTIKILPTQTQTANVRVPNVVGLDVEQATSVLHSDGLTVHGPAGVPGVTHIVTGTTPKAGSQVAPGTNIALTYRSTGASHTSTGDVTVPNVVGQEQQRAFAVLNTDGLRPVGPAPVHGKIHYVISQNPHAGAKVKRGTTVHLTSRLG